MIINKYLLDKYIFNPWKIFCNSGFHEVFLQNKNHQAVKKMERIENRKYDKIQTKNR